VKISVFAYGAYPNNYFNGQEQHMKYYSVAELDITDQICVPAYVKNVTKLVERHGGRYLARTSNIEKFEGERKAPQVFLMTVSCPWEVSD
jgi:Domain of unknown function (DUF1330)